MEVNAGNRLVTSILQNIFFCALLKIKTHTGLEQVEGESMMTEFSFLVNDAFSSMDGLYDTFWCFGVIRHI